MTVRRVLRAGGLCLLALITLAGTRSAAVEILVDFGGSAPPPTFGGTWNTIDTMGTSLLTVLDSSGAVVPGVRIETAGWTATDTMDDSFDTWNKEWADANAVLDCMLYVDLNPVRAGLVKRPEDWTGTSIHLRDIRKANWLLPLHEVLEQPEVTTRHVARKPERLLRAYRARLYYRGEVPAREGQAAIPRWVVESEQASGFAARGVYLKRLRYFTDGLVIGSRQGVRTWLAHLRATGRFARRIHPVPQLDGIHFSAREQRSNFIRI